MFPILEMIRIDFPGKKRMLQIEKTTQMFGKSWTRGQALTSKCNNHLSREEKGLENNTECPKGVTAQPRNTLIFLLEELNNWNSSHNSNRRCTSI
jgi:hypothetical protein